MGSTFGLYGNPWFDGEARAGGFDLTLPGSLRSKVADAAAAIPDFAGLVVDIRDPTLDSSVALTLGAATDSQRLANRTVVRAAIERALLLGRPVFIPEGRVELASEGAEWWGGGPTVLEVGDDLTLIGCGSAKSTLFFAPPSTWPNSGGFRAIRAQAALRIEGLTLEGPDTMPNFPSASARCIQHTTGARDIRLYDVHVTGWFSEALDSQSGGGGLIDIDGCDIRTFAVSIGVWSAVPMGKRLHMRNTAVRFTYPCATFDDGRPWAHFLYINPSVSMDLRDCTFGGPLPDDTSTTPGPKTPSIAQGNSSGRAWFGMQHYSAGTFTAQTGARYVRLRRCTFENADAGLLTSGGGELVELQSCSFRTTTAVQLHTSLTAVGCHLIGCATGFSAAGVGAKQSRILIADCDFQDLRGLAVRTAAGSGSMSDSQWVVDHCRIVGAPDYAGAFVDHAFAISSSGDPKDPSVASLHLLGCQMKMVKASDQSPTFILGGKRLIVENCRFVSTGQAHGIGLTASSAQSELVLRATLRGNSFELQGGDALTANNVPNDADPSTGPAPWVTVDGSNNSIDGGSIYVHLHAKQAGFAITRRAASPNPVKVNPTGALGLSWNFDEYDVEAGPGTLSLLNVGEGTVAFGGMVTLHLLEALILTTGADPRVANIKFVKATNRSAGETIRLVHNPRTQLWYEVD